MSPQQLLQYGFHHTVLLGIACPLCAHRGFSWQCPPSCPNGHHPDYPDDHPEEGLKTMSNSGSRLTTYRERISTWVYPSFHGNTHLSQNHYYFDLTGTSHIVHSLDKEVDTDKWNLYGHTVDLLYPTGLSGGTCIAMVAEDSMKLGLKVYETVTLKLVWTTTTNFSRASRNGTGLRFGKQDLP